MSQVFKAPALPDGYFFRVTPYDCDNHVFDVRIQLLKRGCTVGKYFPKNYPNKCVDFCFSNSDKPERILYWMEELKKKLEAKLNGPVKNRDVLGDYPLKKFIG